MKVIRMLKTMAGPTGAFAPGQVRTVTDDVADMLVGAEAAEVMQTVAEAEVTAVLTPDQGEVAAVEPAPETAALETATARKRVKK